VDVRWRIPFFIQASKEISCLALEKNEVNEMIQ
jgi:hypothetical protein